MPELEHLNREVIDELLKLAVKEHSTRREREGGCDLFSEKEIRRFFREERRPARKELEAFLHSLSHEQRAEVQALFWLGRDENGKAGDWPYLMENAMEPDPYEVDYLMGKAELRTNIESGLAKLQKGPA